MAEWQMSNSLWMLDAFEPPIFCAIFHWASFCFCKIEIELFLHSFSAVFPTSTNFQFEKNAKNCRLQTMYVFLSKSEGITNYIKKMKRKHFYLKSVSQSVGRFPWTNSSSICFFLTQWHKLQQKFLHESFTSLTRGLGIL